MIMINSTLLAFKKRDEREDDWDDDKMVERWWDELLKLMKSYASRIENTLCFAKDALIFSAFHA